MTTGIHRLTIATLATDAPMGAQGYQESIARRAARALAAGGDRWEVDRAIARSMRSPLPGNRRLPVSRVASAPASVRRALGRALYGSADVVHRMNLELPPASGGRDVVTLHDVVAWRFADESAPVGAAVEELRRAAGVICVSAFTAQEAADLLGVHNVHIVPNGVDGSYFDASPLPESTRRQLGIPSRYVLHAGGASARKNLDALAAAWPTIRRARPDLSLVLSGPPHPRRTTLFEHLDGTVLVGRLPGEHMPGLVAGAAAVVVPSLYEGFGLPALEAMAAGAPLVAARTSSLPEVVGDTGVLVEPTAAAIAQGVIDATSDDSVIASLRDAARLRAAGFTWERSAQAHAHVWRKVGA